MPPSYRYLEHRSDLFIEGTGKSVAEAVESLSEGLFDAIKSKGTEKASEGEGKGNEKVKDVKGTEKATDEKVVSFTESGRDFQDLIINIFTRVLAEMDIHSKLGHKLEVKELDITKNTAKLKLHLHSGKAKMHVKAVTYHGFALSTSPEGYSLKVLFDI